jgi:arginyl-tRNA synthetase
MTYDLKTLTQTVIVETFGIDVNPEFKRTEPTHGDFTTNIALQLAKQVGQAPREVADKIVEVLKTRTDANLAVAGPGFINITLSDSELFTGALQATVVSKSLAGKSVVAEYSDPNPFKALHAGHLYTSLVGDTIANIVEAAGATVHRVNFGGDVGLHVAKTMWAIIAKLEGEFPEKLADVPNDQKLNWVSSLYVDGNAAYETDDLAKQEIIDINKRVYELHATSDHETPFAQIYWKCREWSYDGFNALYDRLGMVPFERYYPESSTTQLGIDTVQKGLTEGIFNESDGAVVYDGEKVGLHTRVFINSQGLPTYEAKDLGLALTKWQDYNFDASIIITGNDIKEYMKVIVSAVSAFNGTAAERTVHLTHGQVKLEGGVKMSSRLGNTLSAEDILDAAFSAGVDVPEVVLGAVRYSFLKIRVGGDIIYNPKESISMDGNSGPYIQYALVRARSILAKLGDLQTTQQADELDQYERDLARQIGRFPEAFALSLQDYSPHHVCNYLYELAVVFNRFYENSRVVGHERSEVRGALVVAYEAVLNRGLEILGMPRPEKM